MKQKKIIWWPDLLGNRANIEIKDLNGDTPLGIATSNRKQGKSRKYMYSSMPQLIGQNWKCAKIGIENVTIEINCLYKLELIQSLKNAKTYVQER